MAHEIEDNKAFFVGKPAWHGLGRVLTDAPTIEEAWRIACPHTFLKLDLQAVIESDGQTHTQALNNSKVIIRDDGKEFNTVGSDFELVQPMEILNHFKPLLDTKLVKLEAGGSLRGGSQMWALGRIDGSQLEIAPNDTLKSYFLMFTGFDGSLRIGMSQTNVRVVCANTLASAQGAGIDHKFKHTKNVRYRMSNAIDTVKGALEDLRKDVEAYRYLANRTMTESEMRKYVTQVFLTNEEQALSRAGDLGSKKQSIVNNVIELLDTQRGLDLVPAIKGTRWQAYNAVTEYVTHNYGRSEESRLNAQWFGESAKTNTRALELALTM